MHGHYFEELLVLQDAISMGDLNLYSNTKVLNSYTEFINKLGLEAAKEKQDDSFRDILDRVNVDSGTIVTISEVLTSFILSYENVVNKLGISGVSMDDYLFVPEEGDSLSDCFDNMLLHAAHQCYKSIVNSGKVSNIDKELLLHSIDVEELSLDEIKDLDGVILSFMSMLEMILNGDATYTSISNKKLSGLALIEGEIKDINSLDGISGDKLRKYSNVIMLSKSYSSDDIYNLINIDIKSN